MQSFIGSKIHLALTQRDSLVVVHIQSTSKFRQTQHTFDTNNLTTATSFGFSLSQHQTVRDYMHKTQLLALLCFTSGYKIFCGQIF
jgi:hypothetical protein